MVRKLLQPLLEQRLSCRFFFDYGCQESKAISIITFLWVAELLKYRDVLWPCTKVQLLSPAVRQARTRDLPNSEQNSLAATGKGFHETRFQGETFCFGCVLLECVDCAHWNQGFVGLLAWGIVQDCILGIYSWDISLKPTLWSLHE